MIRDILFEYQKEAVQFHIDNKYSIDACALGLGKSLIALGLIEKLNKKTLIVVPAFLVKNWQDEITKYCSQLKDLIRVVSYSQIHKEDVKQDAQIIILDEAHYIKNRSAQRSKVLFELVKRTKPEYFLAMSGTPIKNYLHEFWMILRFVSLGGKLNAFEPYERSYWKFALRFCLTEERYIYGRKVVQFGGAQNVEELKDILSECMFRRKASEVLNLPPSISKNFVIKDKAKTDAALLNAYNIYDSGKVIGEESFAETKTVNALSKVEFTCEIAKEVLEEQSHLIIFTDHVASAEALQESLGGYVITGKINVADRMSIINKWKKSGGTLTGTFGSMGTGLTLVEAKFMIINDFPWVGSDLLQGLKRIMRIGQNETCFYYYVFSSDTDEYIFEKVMSKAKSIKEIL